MVKIQIRVPDELYTEIKELAGQKEWSLGEAFCRGAELLLERYPKTGSTSWAPPVPRHLGWRDLTHAELHTTAIVDMEPRIEDAKKKR